jgi:hypothetical protein
MARTKKNESGEKTPKKVRFRRVRRVFKWVKRIVIVLTVLFIAAIVAIAIALHQGDSDNGGGSNTPRDGRESIAPAPIETIDPMEKEEIPPLGDGNALLDNGGWGLG